MLDERKTMVLQAIINDYIESAEPVGSRTLARRYALGVSPATIRNEMSDLEDIGYIIQPHVSAGRIPSDKGYRFYVDMIMEPLQISSEKEAEVRQHVAKISHVEQLVQETSRLLALLTQYVAIVIAPPIHNLVVRQIQLIGIDDSNILVVLILDPGMVQNRVMKTQKKYDAETLQHISQQITKKLRGVTYRDIGTNLVRELKAEFGELGDAFVAIILSELITPKHEQLYLNGAVQLFNQPEFHDIDRAKGVLSLLEKDEFVTDFLNGKASSSGVQASIGHENQRMEMQECSVISSTYSIGGQVIGAIGVIGPTRMEYAKTYSVVELMANSLSEILSDLVKK